MQLDDLASDLDTLFSLRDWETDPATEFLVMKAQLAGWFADRGLPVTCLPQADWWR